MSTKILIKMMEIMDRVFEISGYPKEEDEEYREISKETKKALTEFTSMIAE